MSKYLSEDVIKRKIKELDDYIEASKKNLKMFIDAGMFGTAKIKIDNIYQHQIKLNVCNGLLSECEEIEPKAKSYIFKKRINDARPCEACKHSDVDYDKSPCNECTNMNDKWEQADKKPKQCKDCEESVIYSNNGKYRPQICFCKKYEKFVDEYTECLDETLNM